jgi:hypothetical protein
MTARHFTEAIASRQARASLHDMLRDERSDVFSELTDHRPAAIMASIDVPEDTACVIFTIGGAAASAGSGSGTTSVGWQP